MSQLSNTQKFKTVTTNLGRNAVAMAHATGSSIKLTHMAVGDGSGQSIEPNSAMTKLVHEVYRGQINDIVINQDVEGEFTAELLIPQSVGGFFIREVGLFFEDGTMFAIGSTPLTEKTELSSGVATDLLVRMIIRVLDAGTIEILIDPAQVLATRSYVERVRDDHDKDENAHAEKFEKINQQLEILSQLKQIAKRSTTGGWTILCEPNKSLYLYVTGDDEYAWAWFLIKKNGGTEEKTPILMGYDHITGMQNSNLITILPQEEIIILEVFRMSKSVANTTIYAYQ